VVTNKPAKVPCVVLQAARLRFYAKSIGKLAKTDPIDACLIATFANHQQPAPMVQPTQAQQALRDLERQRKTLLQHRQMLQLQAAQHPEAKGFQRLLSSIQRELDRLQLQSQRLPATHRPLADKVKRLTQIQGVAATAAIALLA
jgi:transposase